jgi:hypothetical protein
VTTVLACDISTREFGWCSDAHASSEPSYGLILLPGLKDLGRLNAAVRNSLCDLVERFRPAVLTWCRPMFRDQQSAAEALNGVAAIAHLVCFDYDIKPFVPVESTARKDVLGRGSFGQRDAKGKIIPGTGTKMAKAAALAWCARNGIDTDSDDIADAAVLHAHAKRQLAARDRRPALPY